MKTHNAGANAERTAILKHVRSETSKRCGGRISGHALVTWLLGRNERYNKRPGGLGRAARRVASVIGIVALLATFTGCATAPEQSTLQRVVSASKVAAYVGATEYLKANPDKRPAFEAASATLRNIEASETVDLATLLAIINQLPVKELRSDRAVMLITAGTILLSDYAGSLPVDQLNNLKPVAGAIRQGIDLALQQR